MTTIRERRRDPAFVRDVLLLVGLNVPVDLIAVQTPGDRERAVEWAGREHLGASDNPVRRKPKPEWISLFEVLEADPEPCQTAVGRWAEHTTRVEASGRVMGANEGITLGLATGAVMAQQLMLSRMRERFAAALATAAAYGETDGERHLHWVIAKMTREILGSDEAYREFTARFGESGWREGTAP
jgi:hypothetical protein